MADQNSTNTKVKFFLEAKTPQELVEAQLANNFKFSTMFQYDIMLAGKTWMAWYVNDLRREVERVKKDSSRSPKTVL